MQEKGSIPILYSHMHIDVSKLGFQLIHDTALHKIRKKIPYNYRDFSALIFSHFSIKLIVNMKYEIREP
jgi:hypothetical protein